MFVITFSIIKLYSSNGFRNVMDYFGIIIIKLAFDVGIELGGIIYAWFGVYIYDYNYYRLKADGIIDLNYFLDLNSHNNLLSAASNSLY